MPGSPFAMVGQASTTPATRAATRSADDLDRNLEPVDLLAEAENVGPQSLSLRQHHFRKVLHAGWPCPRG